jgi:Flp pilus assembly protein TadG
MRISKLCARSRRGAALVEFALVLPILLMLFLGIVEFGVMMMHQLTLVQVAREGSRQASLGRPLAQIQDRILNMAGVLPNHNELVSTFKYSTDQGQTYPYTLGDAAGGTQNNAPAGSLIRITLNWPHHLLTGSFFSWLSNVHNNTLPLKSDVIMRRE